MRTRMLAFLLAVGAIFGFASGFHELRWRHWARRAAFERHVAEICVDAARTGQVPPAPGRSPWPSPGSAPDW